MRTSVFALALVVLTTGLVVGCGPSDTSTPPTTAEPAEPGASTAAPEPDKPIRVAFVTNNASDFWAIARLGSEKARKELGCEVEFKMPAGSSAQDQQQIVEDLITRGVSGIAISVIDPENQIEMLNTVAAKVNLITQDSDAPDSDRACYIGTNNYEAGVAAGELIKQALPDGGKIMLFVGDRGAQNAQDRQRGIADSLAGTGIEILDLRTDEGDRVKAITNVQDALVANPDLACLVGLWSYNGPAILNGVRDSGKLGQVKIVCFDERQEVLQGIEDGHLFGTIVQQPFGFGYESVQLLVQLARGDTSGIPDSKQIFIPVKTITAGNVAEFWAELKRQTGKS